MQTFYEINEMSEDKEPTENISGWINSIEEARREVEEINKKYPNVTSPMGIFRLTLEFVE